MVRFRLLALPRVTPSKMGLLVVTRVWPRLLMIVPPKIVPLTEFNPPVLNTPALEMSSVCPMLFKIPVMLTKPPVRVKLPSTGVLKLPPKLSTPPERLKPPVLVPLVPDRFKMPPDTLSVPALLQLVELCVVVPAEVDIVPLAELVKLVTVMVEVVAAKLWLMVPLLITVATLLS